MTEIPENPESPVTPDFFQNQTLFIMNPMPYPDFLDVQLKSFRDFLQLDTPPEERKNDGLYKVFSENFPITDTRNNFVLEFLDYFIDPPRYTIDECLERGLTYSVPLKAKMKLYCTDPEHEEFPTSIQDVFLGTIPYMTENGTFIINGAERVVVSQLHRSPGVFFGQGVHANGTVLYSARIIPFKGSWIEFATDINNVMYAYIDRKKKLPVTTLLRAIGFEADKDILQIFDLAEEVKVNKKNMKEMIGRNLAARVLKSWNEDFVDEDTGEVVSIERNEVIMERETEITKENVDEILESGASTILVHTRRMLMRFLRVVLLPSLCIRMQRLLPSMPSSSTLWPKTPPTQRKRLCSTSIVSCVMLILQMMPVHVRSSRICSSLTSAMISVMWAVIVSTRNSVLKLIWMSAS